MNRQRPDPGQPVLWFMTAHQENCTCFFLLFLLERPQKRKINVRKTLPSRFVNNIYTQNSVKRK
jgi:hypothetical protein